MELRRAKPCKVKSIAMGQREYEDLGVTLLARMSGPNWKHTVKVDNINRTEPDAGLFTIPSDYAIQDSGR
jgi:hypothetical protein